jgi:hypothetical protein
VPPITKAIKHKQLLSFTYDGFARTVEPHTFGITRKGLRMLCAFQVGGGGNSSNEGWKMFSENGMSDVVALDEHFTKPRPEYKQGDGFFKSIIAEL